MQDTALCRAEKSFTHRHLCEFTGLDAEMAIDSHYSEVMDVIDRLFVYMFNGINSRCGGHSRAAPWCTHNASALSSGRIRLSMGIAQPVCLVIS